MNLGKIVFLFGACILALYGFIFGFGLLLNTDNTESFTSGEAHSIFGGLFIFLTIFFIILLCGSVLFEEKE